MAMTVADIMKDKTNEITSISPDKTVQDAVQLLAERRIGSLIVTEGGKMAGIITERDVLWECARHPNMLKDVKVREIMTKNVFTGTAEDSLKSVQMTMTERHIRHLPIVQGDKVVGMVSIGDVVKLLLKDSNEEADQLRTHLAGHYVVT